MPGDLYRNPELYSWAFSHRDVPNEVDALVRWYEHHGTRRRLRTAIELGAGPADHGVELARRNIEVTALDSSAPMRTAARRAARTAGVALEVVNGRLTSFALERRFDLALCLGDTVAHLHTLDVLVECLRCVHRHLAPGGLAVIEAAHPADFIGGSNRTRRAWQITRHGRRMRVRWDTNGAGLDPVTQLEHASVTITTDSIVVEDDLVLRRWTATELDAAARLAALHTVATYGDYDDAAIDDPQASRLIVVLSTRRRR